MDKPEFREQLENLAGGYSRAQVLFTALRGNVFSHLGLPADAEDVAAALRWNARGTRILLDALVAINLVDKQGRQYLNAPVAAQCLVPGAPMDQTHILIHKANGWDSWSRLGEAVQSGEALPTEGPRRTPEQLRDFILGMADIARFGVQGILDAVDLAPCKHMLDIGSGPATYPIAFLQAHPAMCATVFDVAEVIPIAKEQIEAAGLLERFTFVEGDLQTDDLGSGFDLIFISNIVHSFSPEVNRGLIQRCHDALDPGGRLIVKDFFVDAGRTGPPWSLLFAIQMLLHTDGGDTYTTEDVDNWTRSAGFPDGQFIDLTPKARLWVVTKG
jgi:SAM-dependent methyltransferase